MLQSLDCCNLWKLGFETWIFITAMSSKRTKCSMSDFRTSHAIFQPLKNVKVFEFTGFVYNLTKWHDLALAHAQCMGEFNVMIGNWSLSQWQIRQAKFWSHSLWMSMLDIMFKHQNFLFDDILMTRVSHTWLQVSLSSSDISWVSIDC